MDEGVGCAVVVLAAGGSARMGRSKQLIDVGGEPLVRRAARTAASAGVGPVFVVIGAEAGPVADALAGLDVCLVPNPRWREGLAGSLRAGLAAALRALPDLRALVVMPADQPRLAADLLRRLVAAQRASGAAAVGSDYGDHRGTPACLGRAAFPVLSGLRGDAGARALLQDPAAATVPAEPGSGLDLDVPADLARLDDR